MAKRIIASAIDASHPQPGAPAAATSAESATQPPQASALDLFFAIEEDMHRARALNDLASWVGQARGFIDSVRHVAQFNPALSETLTTRGVVLNSPDWWSTQAAGLQHLHAVIADCLNGIESAGSEMADTARSAKAVQS